MTVNKNRGWLHVLAIIFPYLFIVAGFEFLGRYLTHVGFMEPIENQTSTQILTVRIFNLLGSFTVLWLFMRFVDKLPFMKLGFYLKNRGKDIVAGIGLGFLIMAMGYCILAFAKEIRFAGMYFDLKELLIAIGVFIIVACVEEALLRGYVLRNLMISFNKYIALLVSSLLFSLMHAFNPNVDGFALCIIFLAGIFLGISYIHTKNLWFPIGLHFGWNFFQSLFGFNVSGVDFYSLVEFSLPAKDIWNGGAFGFEGSVLAVVFQVLAIITIAFYMKGKNKSQTPKKQR